jgi:hypothetical protein
VFLLLFHLAHTALRSACGRYVSVMEEQHAGQLIWGWTLEGRQTEGGEWQLLAGGRSVGHKRIVDCAALAAPATCTGVQALRFSATETATESPPALRQLAVY